MRGSRNLFKLNPSLLLSYVAAQRKVTRAKARQDHSLYTPGQIAYWLDRLHQQVKFEGIAGKAVRSSTPSSGIK